MTPWVIFCVLIIIGLAAYAWYLHHQVTVKERRQEAEKAELEQQLEDRQTHCVKSIQILANAMVTDQVSLTEGAIRISALSSQLGLSTTQAEPYQVFFQLAEATAHIPILDAWKQLPTKEKLRYDREREQIEEKYQDFVMAAAHKLLASDQLSMAKGTDQNNDEDNGNSSPPLFYNAGR